MKANRTRAQARGKTATSPAHSFAFGEKLRAARERQEMSLRELAAKADMSASMLSQIETGRAYPSVRSIYSIAAALVLPVDYFFPDISNGSPPTTPPAQMTASDLREAQVNGVVDSTELGFDESSAETQQPVVHSSARPTIELKGGVSWARLTVNAEEGAEFLEISYAPGATSGASMSHHEGREFGLVLEGELSVELGFERHALHAGDSIIFDSTTPHRLSNPCTAPMRALWVVLSPR